MFWIIWKILWKSVFSFSFCIFSPKTCYSNSFNTGLFNKIPKPGWTIYNIHHWNSWGYAQVKHYGLDFLLKSHFKSFGSNKGDKNITAGSLSTRDFSKDFEIQNCQWFWTHDNNIVNIHILSLMFYFLGWSIKLWLQLMGMCILGHVTFLRNSNINYEVTKRWHYLHHLYNYVQGRQTAWGHEVWSSPCFQGYRRKIWVI